MRIVRRIMLMVAVAVLICAPQVVAAEPSPFVQGFIEGYLLKINTTEDTGRTAEIETYSGERFVLTVHPQAQFLIDNRLVQWNELRSGMEVYGTIQGRQLKSLEAYSTAQLGFIDPGTKVRKGVITNIGSDSLQVRGGDGTEATYQLYPSTIILSQERASQRIHFILGIGSSCFLMISIVP